ncbi:formate/nitrite transporter family protein, partial [Obesumbacterium proteus]
LTAGVFISLAFVFYITVTMGPTPATGVTKLAGGLCFALGLILVVVSGADLFTSSVLTVMAKASGLINWRQLITNWIIVYVGNFVGAMLLVALIWFAGQAMNSNGQWGL